MSHCILFVFPCGCFASISGNNNVFLVILCLFEIVPCLSAVILCVTEEMWCHFKAILCPFWPFCAHLRCVFLWVVASLKSFYVCEVILCLRQVILCMFWLFFCLFKVVLYLFMVILCLLVVDLYHVEEMFFGCFLVVSLKSFCVSEVILCLFWSFCVSF